MGKPKQNAIALQLRDITFSYVHIFEKVDNNGKMEYGCCILIDKTNAKAIQALEEAHKKAIQEGINAGLWTAAMISRVNKYYHDGDDDLATESKSGAEWEGVKYINAKSNKAQPVAFKAEGGQWVVIENEDELYSGCKGHVEINIWPYKFSASSMGFSYRLLRLYKAEDGTQLGGGISAVPSSAFDVPTDPDLPEEEVSPFN